MKIRIKRTKILKEAAKTPQELPENHEVQVSIGETFIGIRYVTVPKFRGTQKIQGYINASLMGKKECKQPHYKVTGVTATDGWGPMLYDILLEVLYKYKNKALMSDRLLVSAEAKNIWDFYLESRSDVEKIRMDVDASTMNFIYGKKKADWPFQQLTPTDLSDDCEQDIAIYYAVDAGDWSVWDQDDQKEEAQMEPEMAKYWHEQSVSYAYMKKNTETIDALGNRIKIWG